MATLLGSGLDVAPGDGDALVRSNTKAQVVELIQNLGFAVSDLAGPCAVDASRQVEHRPQRGIDGCEFGVREVSDLTP